jgi:hypothetical protein
MRPISIWINHNLDDSRCGRKTPWKNEVFGRILGVIIGIALFNELFISIMADLIILTLIERFSPLRRTSELKPISSGVTIH